AVWVQSVRCSDDLAPVACPGRAMESPGRAPRIPAARCGNETDNCLMRGEDPSCERTPSRRQPHPSNRPPCRNGGRGQDSRDQYVSTGVVACPIRRRRSPISVFSPYSPDCLPCCQSWVCWVAPQLRHFLMTPTNSSRGV